MARCVLKDVPMADPTVGARVVLRAGEMEDARVALKAGAKVGSMGLPWAGQWDGQWDLWGSRSTTGQSIPEGKHARERTSFFVDL